ncbi:MAG: 2-oxo-4-hydroxy-4-carboxy-5-ureidoimidazoline decarboxylase [Ferruginibacter sp.]
MTIHDLNQMPPDELKAALFNCCGSVKWVDKMMSWFPMEELVELLDMAEAEWYKCTPGDWREAFSHHPKIGDTASLQKKFAATAEWVQDEQSGVNTANEQTLNALTEANKKYEQQFGYIFIISATGKSAEEMLSILEQRLNNTPEEEIRIAADEQNKITLIRIQKLMQ